MYHLTNEERETTINFNAAERIATVDTADPVWIRKLDKLCEAYPDIYKCTSFDEKYNAKMYSIADKKYIGFKKPASEARREASRRAAEKARKRPS